MWCLRRSLLQQMRDPAGFSVEIGIALLSGGLMGSSAGGGADSLYQGLLKDHNSLASPAPNEGLLPQLGFFIGLSLGVIGSPAGVQTFGPELLQFWLDLQPCKQPGAQG